MGLFNLYRFYIAFTALFLVNVSFANVSGDLPVKSQQVSRVNVPNTGSSYYVIDNGDVGNSNARLNRPSNNDLRITYQGRSDGVARIEYKTGLTIDSKYMGTKQVPTNAGAQFSKRQAMKAGFRFASRLSVVPLALESALLAYNVFIKGGEIYQEVEVDGSYKSEFGSHVCSSAFDCCLGSRLADPKKLIRGEFQVFDHTKDKLMLRCTYKGVLEIYPDKEDTYNGGWYVPIGGGTVERVPLTEDEAIDLVESSFVITDDYVEQVSSDFIFDDDESTMYLSDLVSPYSAPDVSTEFQDGEFIYFETTKNSLDFSFNSDGLSFKETVSKEVKDQDGAVVDKSDTVINYPSGGTYIPPSSENVTLDIEECRDFPESCKYYEFMKEIPDESDVPAFNFDDLSYGDLDFDKILADNAYVVDLGVVASCPAPLNLDMDIFGSYDVSFQPLCDVATNLNPILQSVALFLSLSIIVGGIRSRDQ